MSRHRSFAGALGPLVLDSLHPKSFLTGCAAFAVAAGLGVACRELGVPQAAAILWMAVASLVLVRIAINSAWGHECGGLFENSGGNWGEAFAVAGRMILLNLVWAIPVGLAFAGWSQGLPGLPLGGPLVLLLLGPVLLPPFTLLLSVGAPSIGAAMSPATWQSLFGGRQDDLLTVMVVSVGGFFASAACAAILAIGFASGSFQFAVFVLLVAGTWSLGATLNLLGRAAGSFLRNADAGDAAWNEPAPAPTRPIDFDPTPRGSTEDSGAVSPFGVLASPSAPHAAPGPIATRAGTFAPQRPVAGGEPWSAAVDAESKAAAPDADSLLDRLRANARIEEDDRDLALDDAQHLIGKFGPHPQVLARVAVLEHRLGHEVAIETAQRAAEAARLVNNAGVLADLYEEFRDGLELTEIERQRMAQSLATRGHYDAAIDLYDSMLAETPDSLPVVKAMIKLAEEGLRSDEGAERALRIYDIIESRWTDHPFLEFVDRGREEVRRRLERAVH